MVFPPAGPYVALSKAGALLGYPLFVEGGILGGRSPPQENICLDNTRPGTSRFTRVLPLWFSQLADSNDMRDVNVGACCLDVRTFTFCQPTGFPCNHRKLVTSSAGEQISQASKICPLVRARTSAGACRSAPTPGASCTCCQGAQTRRDATCGAGDPPRRFFCLELVPPFCFEVIKGNRKARPNPSSFFLGGGRRGGLKRGNCLDVQAASVLRSSRRGAWRSILQTIGTASRKSGGEDISIQQPAEQTLRSSTPMFSGPGLWDQGLYPHFCDTRESPFL